MLSTIALVFLLSVDESGITLKIVKTFDDSTSCHDLLKEAPPEIAPRLKCLKIEDLPMTEVPKPINTSHCVRKYSEGFAAGMPCLKASWQQKDVDKTQ